MTDDERDQLNEALADLPDCANCNHPFHATLCDIESENSFCGCRDYEPLTLEEILHREHPEEL